MRGDREREIDIKGEGEKKKGVREKYIERGTEREGVR